MLLGRVRHERPALGDPVAEDQRGSEHRLDIPAGLCGKSSMRKPDNIPSPPRGQERHFRAINAESDESHTWLANRVRGGTVEGCDGLVADQT